MDVLCFLIPGCDSLNPNPKTDTDLGHPYPHVLINLPRAVPISLLPKAATAEILPLAPSSRAVLHGQTRQERPVTAVPGGHSDSPSLPHQKGLSFIT